jgi:small-conductance mechanosensitive channel
VSFFEALWAEVELARTLWLLGLVGLAALLSHFLSLPGHQARFKALTFFVVLHCLGVFVAVWLLLAGSPFVSDARIPAWIFGSVAFVGSAAVLIFHVLLPRLRVEVPRIVMDVVVALCSVITAVSVASKAGVNLSGLIATSAVATATFGFSLQDVISNIAGGLALQLDNSVEVGDWVRINDVTGKVTEIRWRYTAIETRNWETVVIPNSVLMKSQVTVLGRRAGQPLLLRRWVYFNVDWRYQPSDVISAVQTAVRAAGLQRVATEPAATCVLMEVGESYGRYAVRYWLNDIAVDDPTDSEVRTRIYFALERAGMKFAIPAKAVFVTEESARAEVKTAKQIARRRHLVDTVALFASLSPDERAEVAGHLTYAPFTGGEVMTRQGAEAHWLYLIEDGTAAVLIAEAGLDRKVATLGNGTFFGEMSLLTGEPRSATVRAETDVECFRLDKAAFQSVIERRPAIAQELASLLAHRKVELQSVKEGLDAESASRRRASAESDLLHRIRSFFAL